MANQYPWKEKEEITLQKEKTYKRFSIKTIFSELLDVILVNKGLFYTIKQLTIAPGVTLRGYLGTDRDNITGAAKFFILSLGLFYFIYFQFTHTSYVDEYIDSQSVDGVDEFGMYFQVYFIDQISIWSVLSVFFLAWMSKIFFKAHQLFYTEHFIVHLYINAQIGVYKLLLLPLVYVLGYGVFNIIEVGIALLYYGYVFHHFFREKAFPTLWKTIIVFVFGFVLWFIVMLFFWFLFGIYLGLSGANN